MTDPRQEALERMLAQAAEDEREIEREIDAELRAEDRALAQEFVDGQLESSETPARRPWLPLAAAAAAVFLWLGWTYWPSSPDAPPVRLGGTGVELLSPIDANDPRQELRWSGALKPGEKWTVRVQVAGPDGAWIDASELRTSDNSVPAPAEIAGDSTQDFRWRVDCTEMGVTSGWSIIGRNENL